jgi:hypothetical protein
VEIPIVDIDQRRDGIARLFEIQLDLESKKVHVGSNENGFGREEDGQVARTS